MKCPVCNSYRTYPDGLDGGDQSYFPRVQCCFACSHRWEPSDASGNSPQPNLSRERLVTGHSPIPCPGCGGTTKIVVSYQGRREEWECWGCGHVWDMPATEEVPV